MPGIWRSNAGRTIGGALVALAIGACVDHSVSGPAVPVPSDVTLAIGEHVVLTPERVELGFRGIDGDSRCPTSVQCIWVGQAGIRLWLRTSSRPDSVFAGMTMRGSEPASVESLGYKVTATRLDPYPQAPGPIPPSAYHVTLHIEKRAR